MPDDPTQPFGGNPSCAPSHGYPVAANNPVDPMRLNYRALSDDEQAAMRNIKMMGAAFLMSCDDIGQSRELSLAKTKMEEAVMWAVKHITS